MKTPPCVLTVTRRHDRKNKWVQFTGEYHLDLLTAFGVMPVMVPATRGGAKLMRAYRSLMDGLLMVEGEDVHPDRYGLPKSERRWVQESDRIKDEIEFGLCDYALKRNIPVLGICRGAHILNVIRGGTLYSDVHRRNAGRVRHIRQGLRYDSHRHDVEILRGTPLYEWYRRESIRATSYHHQGVDKLAARYRPMAYADDGLLEAFYDPSARFVVGLQFHPERMQSDYPGNRRVFGEFAAAVKDAYRKGKMSG
jgi:gamma-glutamyl-gamma-aminobutyrate hydrolase PuuD